MNSHFIFNCMNSINSYILENDKKMASDYLTKFSSLIRLILENSDKQKLNLADELAMLETYMQLEQNRLDNKFDYHIHIDPLIKTTAFEIPPLILQPFVENALWHGLNRKEGDKRLTVKISSDDEWIFATIVDNGIGRQKAGELKSGNKDYPRSMGMEITGKRLQLINHDPNTSFAIKDLKDKIGEPIGTEVIIKIKRTGPALGGDKF